MNENERKGGKVEQNDLGKGLNVVAGRPCNTAYLSYALFKSIDPLVIVDLFF